MPTCSNWTRYPIPERDFRTAYSAICAEGMMPNPNNLRFLPLLFLPYSRAREHELGAYSKERRAVDA